MRLVRRLSVTVVLAAVLATSSWGSTLSMAFANGRVTEFVRQAAGPYELALGTIPSNPSVGSLHLTMTVTEIESRAPVLHADVSLVGTGPGSAGPEIGPVAVEDSLMDPRFYDVNITVDRTGEWVFSFTVRGDLGEATADFIVEVKESSPLVGIITIVVLVAFLSIIGLSVRAHLRGRRKAGSR